MAGIFLWKEFRQHGGWFVLLAGLTWCLVLVASVGANIRGLGAGQLAGVGSGLWVMMPIASLILGHLLVSTEYRQKSQLFLEGLPLPRWRMITCKWVIALGLITLYAAGSVLVGWFFAFGTEAVTPRFIGIVLVSAMTWGGFTVSFFFLTGFLGRYRTIVWVSLGLTLLFLVTSTSVPVGDFPPFAVLARFGTEREVWPWEPIFWSWVMVLGGVACSFLIGLAREGSVAAMLGERMSYREKLFIGGGATLTVMSLLTFLESPRAEPFAIPGAVEEEWEGVRVFVSPEDIDRPVDFEVALGARLARQLAGARDWLGLPPDEFPRVYVVEKSGIEEPERIEWELVADDPVVLMYAGYREAWFSENRLFSWTMSQVLRKISLDRVGHEDRWWIVCGLEGIWELDGADEKERDRRKTMARDAVKKHGLSPENLMGWARYQEDVGWREADAVAWMGMEYLAELEGMEAVRRLARATVTKSFAGVDIRAVIWDLTNPLGQAFRETTGRDLAEFVEGWREHILEGASAEAGAADNKK